MKKGRKSYSRDYKIKLVELCKAKGNVSAVSREYGLGINSLNRWIKEFDRYKSGSFPGIGNPKMTDQEAKIAALKKELADVKEERDILKRPCTSSPRATGNLLFHSPEPRYTYR